MNGDSKKNKRCGNCTLFSVFMVDRNLVISPHEVNFGEDGAAGQAVGVVLYVSD